MGGKTVHGAYNHLLKSLHMPLFSGSLQDYVLLEKLNKLTVTKYSEMSDTAKTLITVMEELDKKCKILNQYTMYIV